MADTFRWGVLGTGNIARQFCNDLRALPDHQLVAVASRSLESAAAFCGTFPGNPYGTYDALLRDDAVDAVYVSLPNTLHAEWTIRALEAGKHVLCEKPLATSVAEAEAMFAAAHKTGRTLIEAFMYRTTAQTRGVAEAVRRGDIGRLTHVRTSFCYRTNTIDGNIRFDASLAGGALMDVGCYCLDFSLLLAGGDVRAFHKIQRRHATGVDVMTSGLVEFDNGVLASFTCGMDTQTDNAAVISGTDGFISVAVPWKPRPDLAGYTLARGTPPKQDLRPGQKPVTPPPQFVATPPAGGLPLYAQEAVAFAAACRGEAEPFMPRADSMRLARLLTT